jgi:hypothetical protein
MIGTGTTGVAGEESLMRMRMTAVGAGGGSTGGRGLRSSEDVRLGEGLLGRGPLARGLLRGGRWSRGRWTGFRLRSDVCVCVCVCVCV